MQAVILAAGESSRFWPLNARHKSLVKIMGKPLIWYTIESLRLAGIHDFVIVQGPGKEVENMLGRFPWAEKATYVVQESPQGMGNALLQGKPHLQDRFLVVNAERIDAGEQAKLLLEKQQASKADMVLLATQTAEPWLFGILDVEGDQAVSLVEKPEQGKEPSDMRVVGTYLLSARFLEYYERIPEHQYAYEEALALCMKDRNVCFVATMEKIPSLKYPWNILEVQKALMDKFLKPFVASSAQIAKSAIVEGDVHIGENTRIFENAVIRGPCYIGDNCVIGNNALVREYVNLEHSVMIGANAEVTRSLFQEDVHTHSGYFGDSIFGKGCRIGTGTITANVRLDREEVKTFVKGEIINTGLLSFGVVMGEYVHTGVSTSFMPGVLVGSRSAIGPNSVVFENIENDAIFYTKFEKVVKKREG